MHVVIGYDLHPVSRIALCYGADLARALHARIHVVHVEDTNDDPVDPDSSTFDDDIRARLDDYRRQVLEILGAHNSDWDYATHNGVAAHVLLRTADHYGVSMIVVGQAHHGFGALIEHAMSGSVSRGILHNTRHPVVIVPQHAGFVTGHSGDASTSSINNE